MWKSNLPLTLKLYYTLSTPSPACKDQFTFSGLLMTGLHYLSDHPVAPAAEINVKLGV